MGASGETWEMVTDLPEFWICRICSESIQKKKRKPNFYLLTYLVLLVPDGTWGSNHLPPSRTTSGCSLLPLPDQVVSPNEVRFDCDFWELVPRRHVGLAFDPLGPEGVEDFPEGIHHGRRSSFSCRARGSFATLQVVVYSYCWYYQPLQVKTFFFFNALAANLLSQLSNTVLTSVQMADLEIYANECIFN